MKIKTCLISIFTALIISLSCFSGCFLLPTGKMERARMCSYYGNDDNYVEARGILTFIELDRGDNISLIINFDEEFISQNEDILYKFKKDPPCTTGKIIGDSKQILIDNGFYDLLIDPGYEVTWQNTEPLIDGLITIRIALKIWGDGWDPIIVSVKVGDTVYLDFETGKANLLDWVQNEMY